MNDEKRKKHSFSAIEMLNDLDCGVSIGMRVCAFVSALAHITIHLTVSADFDVRSLLNS